MIADQTLRITPRAIPANVISDAEVERAHEGRDPRHRAPQHPQ